MPRTADTQTLRKRFAEFFAGVGLVRMALEDEGWSCRFANDIDPAKRTLYESHFGDTPSHFELADVASLRGGDVPDVELATASFPCTDLSLAGRRDGLDGPQSSAFWEFLRIIDEMGTRGPDRLLLENVPALLRSQGGADITKLVGALNDLGYLVDAMVMDARWFVPQSRPRLIIVGERHAERTSSPATATRLRPARLHDAMHANASLGWSVADMPEPPERSELTLSRLVSRSERSDRRIDWWSDDRRDYLRSQLSRAHGAYADERVAKRAWTYATAFRRMREDPEDGLVKSRAELRSDGIAGCLRTPKGGSAKQILVKMGYGRFMVRYLTPRECALLMGADTFVIPDDVTDNQALFGFGDAVCVPAIAWLARHRLDHAAMTAATA